MHTFGTLAQPLLHIEQLLHTGMTSIHDYLQLLQLFNAMRNSLKPYSPGSLNCRCNGIQDNLGRVVGVVCVISRIGVLNTNVRDNCPLRSYGKH
jgi:hypothetical protein